MIEGGVSSGPAQVSITVSPVNDPPVLTLGAVQDTQGNHVEIPYELEEV